MDPIAISQTRLGALQIDMPARIGLLGNRYSIGLAILIAIVVEAQLHASRVLAEQRKVNARSVPVRTLRIRIPGHRSQRTVHRSKTPRPLERNWINFVEEKSNQSIKQNRGHLFARNEH